MRPRMREKATRVTMRARPSRRRISLGEGLGEVRRR